MGLLEVLGMARQLGGDPEVIEAVLAELKAL
jgi:hypothetical protein